MIDSVGFKEFYSKLLNGLDTEVGEKGIVRSGVERQRLALARVYFANAKIIILDEVTSAMDNATEELVMKNLMEFLQSRTVITIAHRLSTIKEVDEIFLFNEGELLDRGSFNELLSTNMYFKRLWNSAKENR
ncbi:ATP-binding cassette domain-containing protein [Clostridium cellulovorans]|uniref:ATP-binding cassette domain-containing protein n=1 Tax=Clostridium cellulovorans TaxID=1493 RepID=UPI0002DEA10D|nr:ATP-binding cassette domain-containing protein [Clostridium cellulovorans]